MYKFSGFSKEVCEVCGKKVTKYALKKSMEEVGKPLCAFDLMIEKSSKNK